VIKRFQWTPKALRLTDETLRIQEVQVQEAQEGRDNEAETYLYPREAMEYRAALNERVEQVFVREGWS
jgi:hypothetical protein